MIKTFLYSYLLFFSIACQPDLEYKIKGYTQKIIVEGTIANNEFPKVYLSLNVPLSAQFNPDSIRKYIISNAKVIVSDSLNSNAVGAKTEILTAGWDLKKSPPHSYFGTDYKGEAGKTYYLTIVYSGYTMFAQTTIPQPLEEMKCQAIAVEGRNDFRTLSTTFIIDPTKKYGYLIYTKKKLDGYYLRTPILYNTTLSLSGENQFMIEPEPTKNDSSFKEGRYFARGNLIEIKICAIDSIATQFYKELSSFSATTGIGNSFFIGEKEPLKSNISYPGFGIWCGKGTKQINYLIP